ncbi:MAG TPA: exodeoxyribonuclease VII large subunit [Bacilli bacterium]|nr:exodeoxyribonuclease VII large subunit [Bacilli bacterium]
MNNDKYLSVSALTGYLKYKFDSDENLKTVFLKGEISNFKSHSSGHLYFSIKDENSKINAIMFSTNAKKIKFIPMEGSKVLLMGRVSVYPQTGNYQIYVEEMLEDGIGNLYVAFEKLKQDLQKEGLFDESHKLEIPKIPSKVGVITAPTGAAIRDIISTIKRRFPICEIIIFPSLVQGEQAAKDIVKNIKLASNYDLDVLIIGRGGGSIEDLWPFNEEIVARAIYSCNIPTISAVGHEIDFTIADFVADHRAPTPTGAAEVAVPNIVDLNKYINQLHIRLNESINKKINYNKLLLDKYKNSFVIKNPVIIYENKKQQLDLIKEKITSLTMLKLDNSRNKFNHILEKLEILNPINILKRGYAIAYKDDKPLINIKNIKKNDNISIKISNGTIDATVNDTKEN